MRTCNTNARTATSKRKYYTEYEALTNAVQAAHEQLTAQELQQPNQPCTIQDLIKRMYENTRKNKRRQWIRQQQHHNQQQTDSTNSSSCNVNVQPRESTPVQGHPPAKKQKSCAPTRNQFNRVTYAPYPMEELLSTAYKEIGDTAAQQARTHNAIRKEFTKNLNIRKRVEATINWAAKKERICGHCTVRLIPNAKCKPWESQEIDGDTATCNTWTVNPNSIPSDLYLLRQRTVYSKMLMTFWSVDRYAATLAKKKKEWLLFVLCRSFGYIIHWIHRKKSTIWDECIIECTTVSKTYNKICYFRPTCHNLQQPVRGQWHWRYITWKQVLETDRHALET